mmetsp:Transcript_1658/g.3371  ORF Transcript_1658/g.3371 Transcript_1658/m.3371 type:complete len:87 (+) Transcript_1658:111-371(+)
MFLTGSVGKADKHALQSALTLADGFAIPCADYATIKGPPRLSSQLQKMLAIFPNHILHGKALIRAKAFPCWFCSHIGKLAKPDLCQ